MKLFRSKTTIPLARSSIKHSPLKRSVIFISLAIACFALSQTAKAVVPLPDGGYHNGNTAEGDNALFNLDTSQGLDNTAIGFEALYSNTTGDNNTAIGALALYHNTTGNSNTATGEYALFENTTGYDNTASGSEALYSNTTGTFNTATGWDALFGNTTGVGNTANGSQALAGNITGNDNTAIGGFTLPNNSTGSNNTATGLAALQLNTIGNNNTGNGDRALQENTTGSNNTATGRNALLLNTTGNFNTAMGGKALKNNSTGSSNIAVGFRAGELIDGSANIDVGNVGVAGESGTIRFGTLGRQTNAYVAGISGVTVPAGVGVIIGSDGHLGTVVSSARFKEAVKPMAEASEAILALKPVTFRYKHDLGLAPFSRTVRKG
jgi:hypothetical protein